jgi:hypothetical protein
MRGVVVVNQRNLTGELHDELWELQQQFGLMLK